MKRLLRYMYRHAFFAPVRQVLLVARHEVAGRGQEVPSSYMDELRRQSALLVIPAFLLSFVWLPFLYLDAQVVQNHSHVVYGLRLGLAGLSLLYALAYFVASVRRHMMELLVFHSFFHLGSAAIIAALDIGSQGYYSSLLVLLVAPCLLPIPFEAAFLALAMGVAIFSLLSWRLGLDLGDTSNLYRLFDVWFGAAFSLLFLFVTDIVRKRGWQNGWKAYQRSQRVLREVLERRKAEESLRESERLAHRFLEVSQAGMVVIDAQNNQVVKCNAAFLRMTGYAASEVEGRPSSDTFARLADELYDRQRMDAEPVRRQTEVIARDGILVPVIKNSQQSMYNGRAAYIESYIDISDVSARLPERLGVT